MVEDMKDKNEKYKRDIDNALFKIWRYDNCSMLDITEYLRELIDNKRLYKVIMSRYEKSLTVRLFLWIAKRFRWFK